MKLINDLKRSLSNNHSYGVLSLDELWEVRVGEFSQNEAGKKVQTLALLYQGEEPEGVDVEEVTSMVEDWAIAYLENKYEADFTPLTVEVTDEEDWTNYEVTVLLPFPVLV